MATRSIQLTLETPVRTFIASRGDVLRMRITASEAVGLDENIFLHQKSLRNAYTGAVIDDYVHVASPFDLSIYPIGEPSPTQQPPFFLKNVVDIIVDNTATLADAWAVIQEAVQGLLDSMGRLEELTDHEVVTITSEAADEDASESESV